MLKDCPQLRISNWNASDIQLLKELYVRPDYDSFSQWSGWKCISWRFSCTMCVACAPACTMAHCNTHPCPEGCDHEQEFEQSGNSEHFKVSSWNCWNPIACCVDSWMLERKRRCIQSTVHIVTVFIPLITVMEMQHNCHQVRFISETAESLGQCQWGEVRFFQVTTRRGFIETVLLSISSISRMAIRSHYLHPSSPYWKAEIYHMKSNFRWPQDWLVNSRAWSWEAARGQRQVA